MRTRLIHLIVMGLLAGLCPACSSLVQTPTANFRSATVKNLTSDGVNVDFAMDLNNPNSVEVPLSGAQYKLALGGVKVVDNQTLLDGAVPAKSSLPFTLPVTLSFNSLLKAEQAIRDGKGDVPYSFDGGLDFKGVPPLSAIPLHVPLQFQGTLSLRKILSDPVALMKNPAARKLAEDTLGGIFSR